MTSQLCTYIDNWHTHKYTNTCRQTDRQTDRQTKKQTDRHKTDIQKVSQSDRQTDRQKNRDRQTDKKTDRQTDRHTHTHTTQPFDRTKPTEYDLEVIICRDWIQLAHKQDIVRWLNIGIRKITNLQKCN